MNQKLGHSDLVYCLNRSSWTQRQTAFEQLAISCAGLPLHSSWTAA